MFPEYLDLAENRDQKTAEDYADKMCREIELDIEDKRNNQPKRDYLWEDA